MQALRFYSRKLGVDFVAVGEGERTVVQFIEKLRVSGQEELRSVPGLIEHNNQLINTGCRSRCKRKYL